MPIVPVSVVRAAATPARNAPSQTRNATFETVRLVNGRVIEVQVLDIGKLRRDVHGEVRGADDHERRAGLGEAPNLGGDVPFADPGLHAHQSELGDRLVEGGVGELVVHPAAGDQGYRGCPAAKADDEGEHEHGRQDEDGSPQGHDPHPFLALATTELIPASRGRGLVNPPSLDRGKQEPALAPAQLDDATGQQRLVLRKPAPGEQVVRVPAR
jgi:hypothetical protein